MIEWMKGMYGDDMQISWGKKHDYLGMDLDYSVPGEVRVDMVDYPKKIIGNFPEEIRTTSPTPASDHLFNVPPDDERKILDKERAAAFHHAVAQLLFTALQARKDTQTAVAFLMARVQAPNDYDWRML